MIEYRSADANLERVGELAAELVRLNPDLIVTSTGESYGVSCPRARRPRRRARAQGRVEWRFRWYCVITEAPAADSREKRMPR